MRPSPIMTTIIALFLVVVGVFLLVMAAGQPHASAALPGLMAGLVCVGLAAVSIWGSFHWR